MFLQSFTVTIITKSDSPFNVIPSAPIEIRERLSNGSSGTLSLIFSDQAGAISITQPGALANSLGQFTFFAAATDYNAVYDNNGTPVTIAVDVGVTGGVLNARFDRLNPATLAFLIADQSVLVGDKLHVGERATGERGGGIWNAVLKSTVTISPGAPAAGNVVASTADLSLAFELETTGPEINASQFGLSRAGAQSAIDFFASQPDILNLIWDGVIYPSDGTPIVINAVNKSMLFNGTHFGDDIHFYRCLDANYLGYFRTTGDVRNIGLLKSTMPSFDCAFWYLQNFAGWGGVNFAHFGVVKAGAAQVRQATLVTNLSSINEVYLEGLYAQGGNDINLWNGEGVNFWVRGARSNTVGAPVYTTDGTEPSLSGTDKWWNEITTTPFTIQHGDLSYSDQYTSTTRSVGFRNEGSRPIYVHSMFLEGHTTDIIGNVVTENYDTRNGAPAEEFNALFDRETSASNTQRWGNFKVTPVSLIKNSEFKNGGKEFSIAFAGTGGGVFDKSDLPFPDDSLSSSNQIIKIVNTGQINGARITHTFTAYRTGIIQFTVRGVGLGSMTIKVGAASTKFAMGYGEATENLDNEYTTVGSAEVIAGEEVIITVYTKGFTTQDTGDVMRVTGFGAYYGTYAPSTHQVHDGITNFEVTADLSVIEDLFTINEGTFKNTFRRVTIFTKNIITAGGGEKIVLDIGMASGSSSVAVTITEISRTAVDGVGGFPDDSGTLTISVTTSGTSYTVKGTLADVATVNVRSAVYDAESA